MTRSSSIHHKHNKLREDDDNVGERSTYSVTSSCRDQKRGVESAQIGKTACRSSGKTHHTLCDKYDNFMSNYWTYEVIGLFFCAGSLVSIIAVLYAFDDRPTPHSTAGVSLNTVIAILATLCRSMAVLLATSVISQQKWIRFYTKSCSLIEVLIYDDAARTPLGSLYLLRTLRLSLVTSLAAAAVVLVLGFEPFIQQSVSYILKDQSIESSAQSIQPIFQNSFSKGSIEMNLTSLIETAINQALYADTVERIQPTCAGTSCKWPPYTSTAFCSVCEDAMGDVSIEPKLDEMFQTFSSGGYDFNNLDFTDLQFNSGSIGRTSNTTYNISLGQGIVLSINSSTDNRVITNSGILERTHNYPETIVWDLHQGQDVESNYRSNFEWLNHTINNIPGPLTAFGYLTLTPSPENTHLVAASAKRCVISMCAQEISTKVINGTLLSNINAINWGFFHLDTSSPWSELYWNDSSEGSVFSYAFGTPDNDLFKSIKVFLADLQGSKSHWHHITEVEEHAGIYNNPNANIMQFLTDIERNCAKIAQSLTNLLQEYGDGHVVGQAFISESFVKVNWVWLTFPITLVCMVITALVATLVQTKRHQLPIWKASPFPLLHNVDDRDGCFELNEYRTDESPRPVLNSIHHDMAKKTNLRLKQTAGSWMFEKCHNATEK